MDNYRVSTEAEKSEPEPRDWLYESEEDWLKREKNPLEWKPRPLSFEQNFVLNNIIESLCFNETYNKMFLGEKFYKEGTNNPGRRALAILAMEIEGEHNLGFRPRPKLQVLMDKKLGFKWFQKGDHLKTLESKERWKLKMEKIENEVTL